MAECLLHEEEIGMHSLVMSYTKVLENVTPNRSFLLFALFQYLPNSIWKYSYFDIKGVLSLSHTHTLSLSPSPPLSPYLTLSLTLSNTISQLSLLLTHLCTALILKVKRISHSSPLCSLHTSLDKLIINVFLYIRP